MRNERSDLRGFNAFVADTSHNDDNMDVVKIIKSDFTRTDAVRELIRCLDFFLFSYTPL